MQFKDLSQDPSASYNPVNEDDDSFSISLPFDLEMFGHTFSAGTQLYIDTNGLIGVNWDPENDFDAYSSYENLGIGYELDTAYRNDKNVAIIAPFWDDLELYQLIIDNAGMYYKVEGTAPNRRLIIQWVATDYDTENNILVFQAIIFEGTNDVEFTYGHMEGR